MSSDSTPNAASTRTAYKRVDHRRLRIAAPSALEYSRFLTERIEHQTRRSAYRRCEVEHDRDDASFGKLIQAG